MPKYKRAHVAFALIFVICCRFAPTVAQESSGGNLARLTVREIMAEPSIAGMRPESEKISPDGTLAAFLWSAQGREPRDLYVVQTSGKEQPKILARAVDKP